MTEETRCHNLYEFGHNSFNTRGYTWAASILSKSEMIDKVCPACGTREDYPSGAFDVIVERGSKYPDVLGCGAYPFLIVSEAVIVDWNDADITNFHTYPVSVAEVHSRKLKDVLPPRYFRVEIDGSCDIDLEASGLQVIRYCAECHHLWTEPSVASGFRMKPGTWDGSPLFRDNTLYPRVNFCTEMVLRLASKNKRTNFRFEPMQGPWDNSSKGIDYLKMK